MSEGKKLVSLLRDMGHPLATKRDSPFVDKNTASMLRRAADRIEELESFMNFRDYQTQAVKTAIYKQDVIYPALGLANEAGEVLGKIKKVLRDNNGDFTVDKRHEIGAEIGDVLWYIAALARDLDLPLENIAQENLNKLNSRMARGVLGGSGDKR